MARKPARRHTRTPRRVALDAIYRAAILRVLLTRPAAEITPDSIGAQLANDLAALFKPRAAK